MKTELKNIFKDFFIYLLLCAATFLMLKTILLYASFKTDVAFLAFKQQYLHITIWKIAFYTHVFTSLFTLMAGFTQFSSYVLKHYKKLHRSVGKMYVVAVLFINFPSGLIMAIYANGLLPSKIAFVILDCLWFWFTYKALIEAKRKNIAAHKRFMIRSYALTFSAITLRTWKLVLSYTITIDPLTLYMIDAWLGFMPNLLFAEWVIWKLDKKKLASKIDVGNN